MTGELSGSTVDGITVQAQDGVLAPQPDLPAVELFTAAGDIRRLHDIRKDILALAMSYYCGRTSEVARALGIGRSTLYRQLADFKIEWEHQGSNPVGQM